MKKRITALILAVLMVCTLLPVSAFAATVVDSGTCGDNVTWVLDSDNTLTISGTGAMEDYDYTNRSPWSNYRSDIKSLVIKSGVTSIGTEAFTSCSNLTSVTIPDSVKEIGSRAFLSCYSLAKVTIPNSVRNIGYAAFNDTAYCNDSDNWDNGLLYIGKNLIRAETDIETADIKSGTLLIAEGAFINCTGLKRVTIPNGVTSIGTEVFTNCSNLTSVTIPDSVTSIGDFAFRDCSRLTSVTIPAGVSSIGTAAFGYCNSLTSIKVSTSNKNYSSVDGVLYNKSKTELVQCPCGKEGSCSLPDSVTSIGDGAFNDCSSLTSINVSSNNKNFSSLDGVLLNKNKTELIQCPGGKKGSYSIPNSVTSIGDGAFAYCKLLTSVMIPNSITSIQEFTFIGCSSLKSVTIPNSVKSIAGYAFRDCSSLKSVTIPTSVKSIGFEAFYGCGLSDVYYTGTEAQWKKISIDESNHLLLDAKMHYKSIVKPAAPTTKLTTVESSGKPKLSWNSVSNAAKYEVYRATSKDGKYSKLGTTTNTYYTNTGATAGKTYYYKVRAVASDGTAGSYSTIRYITCDCARPVVKLSNVASSGKIKLSWEAVDGAVKYEVYRATSKDGTYSKLGTTTNTYYTNTGATAGKTYYYKVKAICSSSAGNSAYSAVKSRTCDLARPTVKITTSNGDPKLSWASISGASKYEIYRATSKSGTYTKMYTTTKTSYTNTSAKAGKTYYYKVKAICGTSAAASAYSTVVSIKAK